ncbi:RNA-directed DNA polymerase, eukaryota [Tanacetum coccineum]
MNVICLNVNVLFEDKKKSWIRSMVDNVLPSFLGIQETKMENIDVNVIKSLWPRDNIEFAFCDAVGANADKEILWASLDALISSSDVIWVGFGDFSVVRSREERMGCGCLLVQRPYCSQQPH